MIFLVSLKKSYVTVASPVGCTVLIPELIGIEQQPESIEIWGSFNNGVAVTATAAAKKRAGPTIGRRITTFKDNTTDTGSMRSITRLKSSTGTNGTCEPLYRLFSTDTLCFYEYMHHRDRLRGLNHGDMPGFPGPQSHLC